MTATLEVKVGPHGYVHGWVFVGAPGVGAVVHHPQHGEGRVTRVVGNHVHVKFTGGAEHSFERAIGTGSPRLTKRSGGAEDHARDVAGMRALADRVGRVHGPVVGGHINAAADAYDRGDHAAAAAALGRAHDHIAGQIRRGSPVGERTLEEIRGHQDRVARVGGLPSPGGEAPSGRFAGHAAEARALADDTRRVYSQAGHTGRAANLLDEAAGHLEAGRDEEGRQALSTARAMLRQHAGTAQSSRLRDLAGRADTLHQAVMGEPPSREHDGTPGGPAAPEWQRVHDEQAAIQRAAGEANARGMAHMAAVARAGRTHLHEATGLTAPHVADMRLTHSQGEYNQAVSHLGAGRYAEADAALGRAVDAETAGGDHRAVQRLAEFRGRAQKAAADAKPVLPPLVKAGGNDDGSLRAVDHTGREYAVRLDKAGAVHVTHGGRTLRAAGGTTPTTIARELAGRLVGEELPKPVKPKKLTDAQMRKMPAVTAEGRQLDLYHAEGNEHLDRAARALAEGRNADAANHLTAAEWTAGGLTDRERIARQRAELTGKPPKLAKGETRVVAEGDHQGVHWQATERNEGFTNVRGYRLTYGGQESRSLTGGQGPHAAAEEFRQHVDAQPAKRAAGEEARRRGIDESNRVMLGRDRQRRENNPLDNMQIEAAYEAAHGRAAPQSMRQRWAYDGSNAQDRASDWYKAGVSAKADRGDLTRIGGGGVLAQSSAGRDIRAGDRVRTIRRARAAGPFADESGGEGVVRGVHEGYLIIGTGDKRQLISARPEDVEHAEAAGPDRERVMLQPEHPGGGIADDVARTADAIDTAAPGADPQRALAVQASLRQAAASLRAGNHREAFTHLSDAGLNNIPLGHDSPAVTTRDGTPAASAVQRHMTSVLAMGGTPGTGPLHSETHAGARGREFRIEETGKGTHKITANGRYVGQGRTLESARQLLAKRASGAAVVESAAKSQKAHSALADQIDESANQISLEQSHSAAGPIKAAMRRAAAALRNGDSYQAGKELADAHQRYMFAAQRGAGRGGAGIRTAGTTEHGVVGARFAPEEITKHLRALNK